MKVRTDFVTNSSSSSFVVELELETKDGVYAFETKPTDEGANSNFKLTGKDIINTSSVNELCNLLQKSMSGTGKSKIKTFTEEVEKNIKDIEELDNIILRRIWISYGESSGCTVLNDINLASYAKKVLDSKNEEKELAIKNMDDYLNSADIYVEGGWGDVWPTKFCGSKVKPRYKWSHMGISTEKLAKLIVDNKINNNDLAVETLSIDFKNKSIKESADFILDGNIKGIGKKTSKKSNKIIKNCLLLCTKDRIEENVSPEILKIDDINNYSLIDFVIFNNKLEPKMFILIKTTDNSKSKEFKNTLNACQNSNIETCLIDSKTDNTEIKIISKINESIYSEKINKYVITNDLSNLKVINQTKNEIGHTVKVKFGNNRSYEYNCFYEISPGTLVTVEGAMENNIGIVLAITGDKTPTGYYNVINIYN